MKLNIKRLTPIVVACGLVLCGCKVNAENIHENNINTDVDSTIEFNVDNEDWKELFSDNIEGTIYGVSKNLTLSEDNACRYLHELTGSDITFQDCEDFYINRFEAIDDRVGTLKTIDTLYVDHNEVCKVSTCLEADSLVDSDYTYIPVVDLIEQGVDLEDIDLDDTMTSTDIYSHIFEDSNVTINSTDFTTEFENMEYLDKDSFFNELRNFAAFEDSFEGHEDIYEEINSYDEDSEYLAIRNVTLGPDGNIAREKFYYFCDDELLLGYTGDYNLMLYLPGNNQYVYLDDIETINDYLDETYSSNEQLFTIQDAPGYTVTIDGKYNGQIEKGYSKTY